VTGRALHTELLRLPHGSLNSGAAFGFAVAVKIWALVPLAVAGLLVVMAVRAAARALPADVTSGAPSFRV
jgi:hypothetical protein